IASGAKATVGENIASGVADVCTGVNGGLTGRTTLACSGAGVLQADINTGTSAGTVVIVLTPTESATGVDWACTTTSEARYVPAECR
ncbi:MAG: pilin, partial [Candidatus Thiodiazotropha taylori]